MINKEIVINKQTRDVIVDDFIKLGVDGENLQENIIFKFDDEFVNGTGRVEITAEDGTTSYIMVTKQDETYVLPIKSIITKKGLNTMQLVITQGISQEEIPIFKSKTFSFFIDKSINAKAEAPEDYPEWIDEANAKLNELDNLDIDAEKVENTATITITKKDETQEIIHIYDGEQGETGPQGPAGKDGVDGKNGVDGKDGENGQDGFSPVVSTSKSGKITTIEITDKNGTHTATINDGVDGQNGQNGQDGYSPSASVSQSGAITTISITDKNGTTTASIDLSSVQTNMAQYIINTNSSSNPFIFEGKKAGQYIFNSRYDDTYFYYKIKNSDTSVSMISKGQIVDLCLYSDFDYDNAEENYVFGYAHFNNNGDINTHSISKKNQFISNGWTGYLIVLSAGTQTLYGIKKFYDIPEQYNTTAPTNDKQFTNKKYVDDQISTKIGNINTILATLTTPSNE